MTDDVEPATEAQVALWRELAAKATPEWCEADKWMREFADAIGESYDVAIGAGHDFVRYGEYYTQFDDERARDEMSDGETRETYWRHWQAITGVAVDAGTRQGTVFSCSC